MPYEYTDGPNRSGFSAGRNDPEGVLRYGYAYARPVAARAETTDRVAFIRRTYAHLGGAILALICLEAVLLAVVPHDAVLRMLAVSPFSWLVVLGAFMVAGWVAQTWARSETSVGMQYAGLTLYVVAQAVILLPLLILAADYCGLAVIPTAGLLTLAVFGGLTASVFISRKDFSFLRPILFIGSLLALGLIVASILFSFNLGGVFFAFAMVALMSGYILYYTSNVMLYYRTDQHVAAALALFAAVATLFWYILQIVMRFNRR